MAQVLKDLLRDLSRPFVELIALWHWLSNLIAFLTAISEHGMTGGVIIWLFSGFASAIVSEAIQTSVPSYLRPIVKYFFE
jgi:hypothetical protein